MSSYFSRCFFDFHIDFATALTNRASLAVNNGDFTIGGQNANGTVLSQVLKYDPTLHTYTVMKAMPGPRFRFGATLLDSKPFSKPIMHC